MIYAFTPTGKRPLIFDDRAVFDQTELSACPSCSASVPLRLFHYVNLDAWPEFRELALSEDFGRINCSTCGPLGYAKTPIIADLERRGLTVFAAINNDSTTIEDHFLRQFDEVLEVLPEDTRDRLLRTPYTFVHGVLGLETLLQVFDGRRQHRTPIMLIDPSRLNVGDILSALESLTLGQGDRERLALIREALVGFSEILDSSDTGLSQEIGRIALECNQLEDAERWLEKAERDSFKWLALTAITREDHQGWHFPIQQEHKLKTTYHPARMAAARGFGEGRIDHLRYDLKMPVSGECYMQCAMLCRRTFQMLDQMDDSLSRLYWKFYIQGRWEGRLGDIREGIDQNQLAEAATLHTEILELLSSEDKPEEPSDFAILAGQDARVPRLWRYLEGAASELQRWYGWSTPA